MELATPFTVVAGHPNIADRFPRITRDVVLEQARRRAEEQRVFDPGALSAEERLGWKLSELKAAARDLQRRAAGSMAGARNRPCG